MKNFPFKMPPMAHQLEMMRKAWPMREFAYFCEMGTGKTFAAINLASGRFMKKQINAVVVVCPTPIKSVWMWEAEKFSPVGTDMLIIESGVLAKKVHNFIRTNKKELKYLIVGVEALSAGKAFNYVKEFAEHHDCMCIVDESSKIKNAQAARTKKVIDIGAMCDFRLIMTGTPITQGVEDLFAQFAFLNRGIIGLKSYFTFKNRYCIMGGFEGKKILGYQQVPDLMDKVAPYIIQIKKKDALDLPPKVYERMLVEPTKEQKNAIKNLKDFFEHQQGDDELTVATVMERMLRYQQICGGNFPFDTDNGYDTKPVEGKNPKLDALMDHLDAVANDTKVIIWARFRPELDLIAESLRKKYGKSSVVEFHGGIDKNIRANNVIKFQEGSPRFFLSNQATGGMGITLTAATLVYYFSNSFSFEDRVQSEDRCHRKGQENKVTYVDIVVNVPADTMTLKALKAKQDTATYVDEQIEARNM